MCPAYGWRSPGPPALMRSADRALTKLTRSKRIQVSWVSRSRRSTVASSRPSAPMHHDRLLPRGQQTSVSDSSVRFFSRKQGPNDSRRLIGQRDRSHFQWLPRNQPSEPAVGEAGLQASPANDGQGTSQEQAPNGAVTHLGDSAEPFFSAARVLSWDEAKPGREIPSRAETANIGDAGENGARRDWTNVRGFPFLTTGIGDAGHKASDGNPPTVGPAPARARGPIPPSS